jgi:hypothetical protein
MMSGRADQIGCWRSETVKTGRIAAASSATTTMTGAPRLAGVTFCPLTLTHGRSRSAAIPSEMPRTKRPGKSRGRPVADTSPTYLTAGVCCDVGGGVARALAAEACEPACAVCGSAIERSRSP